jgi:hypothetical protein
VARRATGKSAKYIFHRPSPNRWFKVPLKNWLMECCSCQLVHEIDFKIVKRGRGYLLYVRATLENKATRYRRLQTLAKKNRK